MAICLKIHSYFYTELNFLRPISHLIIDLGFINSSIILWTLQMKLIIFGRSTPPMGWSELLGSAYKGNFCEIYDQSI